MDEHDFHVFIAATEFASLFRVLCKANFSFSPSNKNMFKIVIQKKRNLNCSLCYNKVGWHFLNIKLDTCIISRRSYSLLLLVLEWQWPSRILQAPTVSKKIKLNFIIFPFSMAHQLIKMRWTDWSHTHHHQPALSATTAWSNCK